MHALLIIPYYISWHYTRGVHDVVVRVRDFLWFFWNMFSIPVLFKTFFEPFERLGVQTPKRFDPEKMLEAIATTLVMRLVGMFVRTGVIVLGVLMCIAVILLGVVFLCVWMVLPVMLIGFISLGVIGLFS